MTPGKRWLLNPKGAIFILHHFCQKLRPCFVSFHCIAFAWTAGLLIRIISCCFVIWANMGRPHGQGLDDIVLFWFYVFYVHFPVTSTTCTLDKSQRALVLPCRQEPGGEILTFVLIFFSVTFHLVNNIHYFKVGRRSIFT